MPVSGTESRRVAWLLLLEQEASGAFLKDLFPQRLGGLRDDDAALVRALCLGVLRHRRLLDFNLDAHAPRGVKDARLRMLLRVGAHQILFLSGVPDFAAVNTTVEIAKREFGAREAGFANAVLKAVARAGLRAPAGNDLRSLALRHSHPEWMVRRWAKALKPVALEAALRRNNEEAPQWIRANPRRPGAVPLVEALAAEGVALEPHPEVPLFFRLGEGGTGGALRAAAFAEGRFAFQDPVAYWVVALLDWRPGLSLWDACAAPGGKAALALEFAALKEQRGGEPAADARIVCGDASWPRLRRIRDARARLGHTELMPVTAAADLPPFRGAFDRILLDAPCSNLGVLRRRPEARWNWTPEKTAALAERQLRLLEGAAARLKPGGRLVYATCSAEAEETVEVVAAFLAAHPEFRVEDAGGRVPPALCREGCLRVWPGETDYDGFFAAALARDR